MPAAVANPYANLELKIPARFSDDVEKYTVRFRPEDGSPKDIDRSPFDLYVDFWWAALGVGVAEGRVSTTEDLKKFVTGVVLNQTPWRITHLELLAIAHTGSADVVGKPGEVIEIANGYAATGAPILVEILLKNSKPIWDVSNHLKKLARAQQPDTVAVSE
jgi:hypothetical protein